MKIFDFTKRIRHDEIIAVKCKLRNEYKDWEIERLELASKILQLEGIPFGWLDLTYYEDEEMEKGEECLVEVLHDIHSYSIFFTKSKHTPNLYSYEVILRDKIHDKVFGEVLLDTRGACVIEGDHVKRITEIQCATISATVDFGTKTTYECVYCNEDGYFYHDQLWLEVGDKVCVRLFDEDVVGVVEKFYLKPYEEITQGSYYVLTEEKEDWDEARNFYVEPDAEIEWTEEYAIIESKFEGDDYIGWCD